MADVIGHLGQQGVALLLGHVAGRQHFVEENLNVHLMVGAVYAAGVVDKVGITGAAF